MSEFDYEKTTKRVALYSELAIRAGEQVLKAGLAGERAEAAYAGLERWAGMLAYLTGEPLADMIEWALSEATDLHNSKAGA
jgi:hypothetical protein